MVLALLIGAASGYIMHNRLSNIPEFGLSPFEPSIPTTILLDNTSEEGSQTLNERQTMDFEFTAPGALSYFQAIIMWSDEPDISRFINQPDSFTLEVTCGNSRETLTKSNVHNEYGDIRIEIPVNEQNLYEASASITLNNAGDQTGPGGLWSVIPDNSNEVYYQFRYEYQVGGEESSL